MACPVYLFTGFLDSGKTTLIKDTMNDVQFMEGVERTLILCFEEGETEYDEAYLREHKAFVEYMDDISELTDEKIRELDTVYHPDQVFIEYNGSQPVEEKLLNGMPNYWPVVQILSTVDATTFDSYIVNMRSMLFEQLRWSDVIICNRCWPDMNVRGMRGNIKAINRRAQIFYEGEFGAEVKFSRGTLPYDINAEVIDINDDDYGIWYMDCLEDPMKYDGKKIILRGMYAENIPGYKQSFVMGRRAMVCCAADTSLCGITVTGVKIWEMKIGDWVEVEGNLRAVDVEGGAKTVVLYATRIQRYHEPEDPYVYFS
ncbi:MAG: hypothetical protein K6D03_07610 [Solobacterium sp.]|nr:hypothetical protein [Solobacterium sp.]